ncbi:hypothetical protein GCM10010156_59540 [Planobispora rosea]|uniref:SnoaL-like domain-containing protein n=1 Tax=Planobispora rosea TaxID=35762 RepID=A0A8J3WGX0_PLARO|nr:nuclear transport factor 2 family protein [Planobispora rosea]GGS93381.1 hypothetical protein GCM10010156_59540 [Planobispora rosea]GIH87256.1 hypothetical protein Pro02_56640 [Planobispora rosea]
MTSLNFSRLHPALDRQLAALAARDLDGLLANYSPDAVVVRFDRTADGEAEIREMFADYMALEPELVELVHYAETDDVIFYRAVMSLAGTAYCTLGTLVLREGRIWRQTAAVETG